MTWTTSSEEARLSEGPTLLYIQFIDVSLFANPVSWILLNLRLKDSLLVWSDSMFIYPEYVVVVEMRTLLAEESWRRWVEGQGSRERDTESRYPELRPWFEFITVGSRQKRQKAHEARPVFVPKHSQREISRRAGYEACPELIDGVTSSLLEKMLYEVRSSTAVVIISLEFNNTAK